MLLLGGCTTTPAAAPPPAPVQEQAPRTSSAALRSSAAPEQPRAPQSRFINSGLIIQNFASLSEANDLQWVPSEVIETGVFRYVRYHSYQAAQFELNIYGNPNHPAGVEIGVYAGKNRTKAEIRGLMARLLQRAEDREQVTQLALEQDKVEHNGLTFEITPATADDAFGGWWISIYDAAAIDKARDSEAELKRITREATKSEEPAQAKTKRPSLKAKRKSSTPRVYLQDNSLENGTGAPATTEEAP